ncbi:MAG: histidinol-phosphatase HisJ family protein [Candidatus Zixiibacteriota bacterium]
MRELDNIVPLNNLGLTDYHCHCDYSIDAVGTIDEYCEAALKRGLAELCFTTHWDTGPLSGDRIRIDGHEKPAVPDNLAPYVDDVLRAREKYYQRGLWVVLGLEYGWYPNCQESVIALKDRYHFDFVLCGVHELDGRCFSCEGCFPNCFPHYSVEQIVDKYVGEIVAAAETGLFNCIAHLDYLRKYGQGFYGPRLNELLLDRLISVAFPVLRSTGTALEVNTSAIRRKFDDYFPRAAIVNAARKAGIEVRYLGSDAHAPDQVGYDFDAAVALVSPWFEAWCED